MTVTVMVAVISTVRFGTLHRRNWASKEKGRGARNGTGPDNSKVKIAVNVTVTARLPSGNSKGTGNVTDNGTGGGNSNGASNINGKVQGTIPPELRQKRQG